MTNYDKLLDSVRSLGMDYKWAKMFVKKLKDDENSFPVADEGQKKWALERGFYPGRIELYGLTEGNYLGYIPDYQYFMLHPMNNHFRKWLDKTTLKYVMNSNGCEDVMPDYYIYIENDGSYTYLMDCPDDIEKNQDFLLNLLRQKKALAMKPNSGTSGGLGFIKLELKEDGIYENNKPIDIKRFTEVRDSMRNYIVTEYVHQHLDFSKIWPDSECTLRIILCKVPKEDLYALPTWSCPVALARFGTSISGGASNMSAGGIGVGFDFETGKCKDFGIRERKFSSDGQYIQYSHPDTGAVWRELSLPNWQFCKKKINDICRHISSLDYLGLDIIISENGMKLCEINTHPAIDNDQIMCAPVLLDEKVRAFFEHKGLRKFDGKDFYSAYIESQD